MYDIAVIGNSPVDALTHVTEDFLEEQNLRKGDFNQVDPTQYAKIVEACFVEALESGGSTANTAWTMAQLGCKVGFIGRVGADEAGSHFFEDMHKADVPMPAPDASAKTMQIYCLITPDGQRTFVSEGVTAPLSAPWVSEEMIQESNWLLIEGYMMLDQMDAVDQAILLARKHGTKIAMTLSAVFVVQAAYGSITSEIMKGMDMIIANDEEMEALLQAAEDDGTSNELVKKICDTKRVITHGPNGATFVEGTEKVFKDSLHVDAPLDTTGGGDAFAAGFLAAYIRDASLEESLTQGHKLGRNVISQIGGRLKNVA